MTNTVFKSLLFVPASNLAMIDKAHTRGAGAVIVDLEDGVAEIDKPAARHSLGIQLEKLLSRGVQPMLRINSLDKGGTGDIDAILTSQNIPILVPKVTEPQQVIAVQEYWFNTGRDQSKLQILPMIECPRGLFRAEIIAASSATVSGLIFGSEDFATEAGLSTNTEALTMPAQWVALAAAATRIPAYGLPGALANYHDMALFKTTLQKAKAIGFNGSLCVHPKQVSMANEVFKPDTKEIEWAMAVLAQTGNGGATGGEAGMVDAPVEARARALLARRE